ncbi:MAG: hypothetical protein AAFW89_13920 [Bacteroidota bacterium]
MKNKLPYIILLVVAFLAMFNLVPPKQVEARSQICEHWNDCAEDCTWPPANCMCEVVVEVPSK